jgi:hypothetical protein
VQVSDLVVEVVRGICQIESLAERQTLKAPNFRLCCDNAGLRNRQRSSRDFDLDLVRFLVKLHQQGALPHPIVVVHQHTHDLTRHPRRHKRHVSVNVGVVC